MASLAGMGGGDVAYTYLRADEIVRERVCRILLEKKNTSMTDNWHCGHLDTEVNDYAMGWNTVGTRELCVRLLTKAIRNKTFE